MKELTTPDERQLGHAQVAEAGRVPGGRRGVVGTGEEGAAHAVRPGPRAERQVLPAGDVDAVVPTGSGCAERRRAPSSRARRDDAPPRAAREAARRGRWDAAPSGVRSIARLPEGSGRRVARIMMTVRAAGLPPRRDRPAARLAAGRARCSAEGAARLLGSGEAADRLRARCAPTGAIAGRSTRVGYRDLERAVPKPAGVRRAVCIGDSFTWGVSVLFDDAWPQRVERTLSRERGERWEAVNLARARPERRPGGEPARLRGLRLRAGRRDRGLGAQRQRGRDGGRGAPGRGLGGGAAARPVRRRSSTARRSSASCGRGSGPRSRTAAGSRASARCTPTTTRAGRPPGAPSRRWGACAASEGCPSWSRSSRSSATRSTTRYPFADVHAKVAQAAGEAGARVVDLLPVYRGLDGRLLVVDGAADEHPNEIAHRIAARAIAQAVDEVVPRPAAGTQRP